MTVSTDATAPEPLLIQRDHSPGVIELTLNNPKQYNALSEEMLSAMQDALQTVNERTDIKVLLISANGRAFCAGHDLEAIASHERAPSKHFEPETVDALERLPQPTIAQLHGHCYTGGLELALACDLLIADETARLGDTHGQWGLVPIWGMSIRLPERVGVSTAKELMFTSRRISGREAAEIGLVDRCVPEGELSDAVTALATEIVANSAGTNRIVKRLISDRFEGSRNAALLNEREMPHGRPDDMAERMRSGGR
ncbi:MAG: enoyl-CoA hydratase/isomerase family protein [Rhodobacterales bacterium]|nr:enoyl-CoA hydratase/isomerase family protein [Rhodobacterales bacterium]